MNNIFLPNDPLLYSLQPNYKQLYEERLMGDRELIDKLYKDYINRLLQPREDKLDLLNTSLNQLDPEIKALLESNTEFVALNKELLDTVQSELMILIKDAINSNPSMISNIDKQITIINELSNKTKEENRRNLSEINDYIKNFSDMSFDEYKKLKNATK